MQKFRNIFRQFMVVVLALQFLNLSVNNPALYEYSYTNTSQGMETGSDPTETALEMILEAKYGQMDIFTYKANPETNKNVSKILCFHIDMINHEPETPVVHNTSSPRHIAVNEKIITVPRSVNIPPPKSPLFA